MSITLGFDVYGTLIDTNGVVEVLRSQVGALAPEFSRRWREKQLEYSFRRGLMQNYQDFAVCTRQALDYTSVVTGAGLSEAQKSVLLEAYQGLPAFPDVKLGLQRASEAQMRLFAFSNGSANAVAQLLDGAGIGDCFLDIISVEQLRSFKPSPAVYCHFLRRTSARGNAAWLVSSNPFDVIGAESAGLRAAWVQRTPDAVFDPWEITPSLTLTGLGELADRIKAAGA